MKTFLLKLDDRLYIQCKARAEESGWTLSEWIRKAMAEDLERPVVKVVKAVEAVKAWDELAERASVGGVAQGRRRVPKVEVSEALGVGASLEPKVEPVEAEWVKKVILSNPEALPEPIQKRLEKLCGHEYGFRKCPFPDCVNYKWRE